jgi:hypothetical protein
MNLGRQRKRGERFYNLLNHPLIQQCQDSFVFSFNKLPDNYKAIYRQQKCRLSKNSLSQTWDVELGLGVTNCFGDMTKAWMTSCKRFLTFV